MSTNQQNSEYQAQNWKNRISAADTYYDKWAKRFKCDKLEDYYEGFQWADQPNYDPYVINLVFSSIQVKRPSLLFSNPVFHLKPKPNKSDFNPQAAFTQCQLREDTLNTFICDDNLKFAEEIELAIVDSFFRFGIVEVGYDAEWVNNPNAGKPIVKDEYIESAKEDEILKEPEQIPEQEWIYVKRIPANRFRVGGLDSPFLERCNWCGYYEYIYRKDLIAAGLIKDSDIYSASHRSIEFSEHVDDKEGLIRSGDMSKVWKIWDLRAKEKIIFIESEGQIIEKYRKAFKRLPLFPISFIKRTKGFYPIPVVFNWKSPQDEINEAREQMRVHRRRFKRAYAATKGRVEQDEVNKFADGPDGTIIWQTGPDAIQPIANAPLDSASGQSMVVSKDDFNIISGTSSEQRGQADRTTATQAQLVNARSEIREQSDQVIVANWLCRIAKEILLQIQEKYTLPFWVKSNIDVANDPLEAQLISETYNLINPTSDFDENIDFKVDMSIESLSPIANDKQKQSLIEFMSLVNQFPQVAMSPSLIREVAYRCNYRNEKVIRAFMEMAQLTLLGQIESGKANLQQQGIDLSSNGNAVGGTNQNQLSQQTVAKNTPNMESIQNQLQNQLQMQ